jgi:hypothetical protein
VSITTRYDAKLFTGVPTTGLVPWPYPVALAGRPYLLDLASGAFGHDSIAYSRQYSQASGEPSDLTLNPEAGWHRSIESWHHGAGQTHLDREHSDRARFDDEAGVDVWDRWQISALSATKSIYARTGSENLRAVVCAQGIYVADGSKILTGFPGATSTVSNTPASTCSGLACDGSSVYALFDDGIYSIDTSANTASKWQTGSFELIGYVKDRLLAAAGAKLYNIASPSTSSVPDPIWTHPTPGWAWTDLTAAAQIYAVGEVGDLSAIYRIGIESDGTSLAVPVQTVALPTGEQAASLGAYLGFVLVGTSRGARLATADADGDLTLTALIEAASKVRGFYGHGRFVYVAGWTGPTGYDGISRMDLSVLNGAAPAYAADLQAADVSDVFSVDGVLYLVGDAALYAQQTDATQTGAFLRSGQVGFGLADEKIPQAVDVTHDGAITVSLSVDGGDSRELTVGEDGHTYRVRGLRGKAFQVKVGFDDADATVHRITLIALPHPSSGQTISVPLLLAETETVAGREFARDPDGELAYLTGLRTSQNRVTYQEGRRSYNVTVDAYKWRPTHLTTSGAAFNGTLLVNLKALEG